MKNTFVDLIQLAFIVAFIYSCSQGKKDQNALESKQNKKTANETQEYNPGSNWSLVWSDEFEGDSIDNQNWTFQIEEAGRFNDEWQRYTLSSDNAFVENGNLVIRAIHEGEFHGMDQYTSARLHTANKQSWKYGKIVARMKLPESTGIWPAFWMLGANIDENGGDTPWPQCGEIDILELYGSKDDGAIEANIHYSNASGDHDMMGAASYHLEDGKFADSFHIFELEWTSDSLKWLVDGNQFVSTSIASEELSEFHKDFFILLNVAVGGTYAGRPDSTSIFPQHMYVDWVRVYQQNPASK